MKLTSLATAAALCLALPSSSFAYEVWMGLHTMPAQAAMNTNSWHKTSDLVAGINPARTRVIADDGTPTVTPAEAAGYVAPDNTEYATCIAAITNRTNCILELPRDSIGKKDEPASGLRARTAAAMDDKLGTAAAFGYTIKYFMVHGSPNGNDWTAATLQILRDELNARGRSDLQLVLLVRTNSTATHNLCASPLINHLAFEMSPVLWNNNAGDRQGLLQWIWANPALNSKKIFFQLFPAVDSYGAGTNEYASMRLFVRQLGLFVGPNFLPSWRVIIMPTSSNPAMIFHGDTTGLNGVANYRNSKTGFTLSLIEQRINFENGASESFCRSDVRTNRP